MKTPPPIGVYLYINTLCACVFMDFNPCCGTTFLAVAKYGWGALGVRFDYVFENWLL